jgi:anthranilate synthase/aminodeoxychorismate synthase-like glutamine amidotransferase
MILFIDNQDSFTWNLVDYFHRLGQDVVVLPNTTQSDKDTITTAEAIVLSPGPGRPATSHFLNQWLADSISAQKPILGVCLGMQAIGEYYGAQLNPYENAVHGRATMINHDGSAIFSGIPSPHEVGRYHSLSLSGIVSPLVVTAITQESTPMAVSHTNGMIHGVQFHPESILSPFGLALLSNWLKTFKA